ncbi:MAG TPA: caspase family protein [Gemmatimonadaceae bacterium]|nr:caspase family protein [Gemmatimonadaceae bacterium]
MPRPFHRLTRAEFADLLSRFPFERRIAGVHLHHSGSPTRAGYQGARTIGGMWCEHTAIRGWSDIAQHVTIAPDGSIWTGRDWNRPPASAAGHNGDRLAGPFMVVLIGDFDRGRDVPALDADPATAEPADPQLRAAVDVVARVQERFHLPVDSLRFHRELSPRTTCPGSALDYQLVCALVEARRASLARAAAEGAPAPPLLFDERDLAVSVIAHDLAARVSAAPDPPEAEPVEGRDAPRAGAGPSRPPAPARHRQVVDESGAPRGERRARGRRRALCIGIDRYEQRPLEGCVADARQWSAALEGLGFEPPTLLLDADATRQAILGALRRLVRASRAGDVVVLQYAGHGTQLPDVGGDERAPAGTRGLDEAIIPIGEEDGAFIIDDDLAAVFAGIPAGVNVTCLMDCCYSGTITRLAVGGAAAEHAEDGDSPAELRPRFIRATSEMIAAHREFRARARGRPARRAPARRDARGMREVTFSACRSTEVAWEEDGHGVFTTHALAVLRGGAAGLTNRDFRARVLAALGPEPRQHPTLDCRREARGFPFLDPQP